MEEELTALKVSSDTSKEIITVWSSYHQEVTKLLISQTVTANGLVDVDWSFGVTSASDVCDQVPTYLSTCFPPGFLASLPSFLPLDFCQSTVESFVSS